MERTATKDCEVCGATYRAPPSRFAKARFCSRACRAAAPKQVAEYTCVNCALAFTGFPSQRRIYCSKRCAVAYRTKRKPFPCENCGVECYPWKNQTRFCSHACAGQGLRNGSEKPCESCGKAIYVEQAQRTKRFCSRPCKNEGWRLKGPGARYRATNGYIIVYYPAHPDAAGGKTVLEHRLVMEEKLGRRLLRSEQVHHINHIKDDNRPENLEIMSAGDHTRATIAHAVEKRRTARERLAEYERRFGPLT